MNFDIPRQVREIIDILNAHTYKAHLVGECVRAYLQKERPLDFDIATNAPPERLPALFEERYKTKPGELPGELIIINGTIGVSVSPYRGIDALGRKVAGDPELTLEDDLRQRVYTADAIAYDIEKGLYDPLGGASCVTDHMVVLKAVGENEMPDEDDEPKRPRRGKKADKNAKARPALPILNENPVTALNAIKRYSRGGIGMSAPTLKALFLSRRELLEAIPNDRLLDSIHDIILGKRVTDVLLVFRPFVFTLIPKLAETDGYNQHSLYQEYPLYEHLARSVGYAVPDYALRLALLLHGIGKRDCEADRGAYYSYEGHEERGAMLARNILREHSFPETIISEVCALILLHDEPIDKSNYAAYISKYGAPLTKKLLLFRSADIRAKSPGKEHEQVSLELRALSDSIGRPNTGNTGRSITSAELKKLLGGR